MTIDEAIKHCQEVAEEQEKLCKANDDFNISQPRWRECANEHRQLAEWLKELRDLKEQQPEDTISMMDLLNNLHKHFSKGFETDEWWNSTHVLQAVKDCRPELFDLNYAPSVQLKQTECEDAVSRQAVLDYIEGSDAELGHSSENELVCQDIKELPPVTPRSKIGHWIPSHIPESILDKCSECGFSCGAFTFTYCPNCGAKMVKSNMLEIPTGSESEVQDAVSN